MNLTALLQTYNERSGEQLNHINSTVVNSLIYIVETFLLHLAPSFVLTLGCRDIQTCNFYNDLLKKLFKLWNAPPIQIVNIEVNNTRHVPGRRNFNLILVDSYESFRATNIASYTAQYNHNEYYYIFLQMRDHLILTDMDRIFDYCWSNQLINCNVQVQTSKGQILVYTYYPFTPGNCGKVTRKLINEFNGTTLIQSTLFPRKLMNFHGCTLRLATWNVPPFMYLEYFNNGSGRILGGIEAHLLKELSAKLNFSIEVRVPPNHEQRGILKGNNATGALAMLRDRKVDFSLGLFRLAGNRFRVATATLSYYQNAQIICFPLKAYHFSSLEMLLFPFAHSTWLLFLAIWLIGFIVVMALKKFHTAHPVFLTTQQSAYSYFNVFALALGMPITTPPRRSFARIFCTNWLILTLVLRSAYQGILFHLLRSQLTNHVPKTIEELVANNYTLVMNRATYAALDDVAFLKALNLHIIKEINDTIQFEYLERHARKGLAAAGPIDFLLYYESIYKKAGVFRMLSQSIVSLPITIYVAKHSYLIDQFNQEILSLRAMGFIDAWLRREFDYRHLDMRRHLHDHTLGLNELSMVFYLWLIGCGLAMLCFFVEITSRNIRIFK